MEEQKKDLSTLMFSADLCNALVQYRENLIGVLGVESEKLVVRSESPIDDYTERLRFCNFVHGQLLSVNEFMSGYVPDDFEGA